MSAASLLSDDEPVSLPSTTTMRGGDPATLGRIDHYDLLRKLGGGGFGVVYLARDTIGGIEVAIKTLHPLLKHNAEEMDLLREKFALVSRLAHPNIATALVLHPVRDINVFDETARRELKLSPGDSVMVMRYAPGVTLSKWRRQFPDGIVPFDRVLEIGRQVASALDYAHGERIVHRDIKPSNIMVETLEGGRVRARILDFGLAAEIRSSMSRVSTEAGDTSGTRPYMAPEQWLGKKQDGQTDQYALACVLYELLSGEPPFAAVFETGDPAVMLAAVERRTPDPVPGLSRGTNAALLRALSKDPATRFPSCTAFVEALRTGRVGSTSRPRRLAAAVVALAVLGTLGAVLLSPRRGESHAEGAEAGFHAESAEGAELVSHAESAEPSGGASSPSEPTYEDRSHAESAKSGGAGSPSEPPYLPSPLSSEDPPSPSVPVLPPDGASLEELQAARGRFADALDARRAEDWPDTTAESASLLSSVSALDDRIADALEAQEKAERDAEAARLAKLEEDSKNAARAAVKAAKDEESIRVLRAGAERDAKKAEPFRKWAGEGEFKTRFATLDGRKKELDGCSKAADLAKAQGAAADVRVAADWIADNAAAREEFDELEKSVDALLPGLEEAEASRYAKSALYRAKTARDEAVRLRDTCEFAAAKEKLESAKAQYEGALASAKTARAAAKAKEALVEAEAAKIRKDWSAVLAAAEEALEWEKDNESAKTLKAEAEKNLKPSLLVSATLPDGSVVVGATFALGGKIHTLPIRLNLADGKSYGPYEVVLEKDGKTFSGTLERTVVDWKGEKKAVVRLEERKGPKPGEPIDLGGGVKLEMVHCPGVAPDFWIGKYEVTQEQWQRVMGTTPSNFKGKPKNPVETVSWYECQEFVRKLNDISEVKSSGLTFRLPDEGEWEKACHAGAPENADYCKLADGMQITSANLSRVAQYGKGWDDGPVPVGSFEPNAWGLHDMHGNVWEWTQTAVGVYRVYRGGSFYGTADGCWAGHRSWGRPGGSGRDLGLRLAASGRTAAVSRASSPSEPQGSSTVSSENAPSHAAGERFVATISGVSVPMRWCPPGAFMMGSPLSEDGRSHDEMQHPVTLTKGFWLGETEVTQGLWKKIKGNIPSAFNSGDDYPVENVSWNDCQDFLDNLNEQAPVSGFKWTLPTEAQWEYACRAGTTGPYAGNGLLDDMGWYLKNGAFSIHPVGQKLANAWGLYDMHGNVYEWCADWDGPYSIGTETDPTGARSGSYHVCRGGSSSIEPRYCRSAARSGNFPDYRSLYSGFRVALVPVQ